MSTPPEITIECPRCGQSGPYTPDEQDPPDTARVVAACPTCVDLGALDGPVYFAKDGQRLETGSSAQASA